MPRTAMSERFGASLHLNQASRNHPSSCTVSGWCPLGSNNQPAPSIHADDVLFLSSLCRYSQRLDHFSRHDQRRWQQRYTVCNAYWNPLANRRQAVYMYLGEPAAACEMTDCRDS